MPDGSRESPPVSILIVDGREDRRAALGRRLCEVPGWRVRAEAVGAGEEALERLRSASFDLVFLDHALPGEDGLTFLDRIRQHHAKAAVVLTAAEGSEQLAVAAMKKGAVDYCTHEQLGLMDFAALFHRVAETRNLLRQNMELRQVNQMKNEFIANVSHELRTPLTVIIGYARTLLDGSLGPLSEPQRKALDAVVGRSEGLLGTVNNILRLRDAVEGRQQLVLRPLDLRELVHERAAKAEVDLRRKGLNLQLIVPREPVWVAADPERLADVVDNLLSNAGKFGPSGSSVRLVLDLKAPQARLSVSDEGPGVPPEMVPHLFAPFGASTQQGPARLRPGLGIGLPLCKELVEAHGGRIWVESQVGHGCVVRLALPLSSPDGGDRVVAHSPALQKRRILIVEDNPDLVDVLMLFLASMSGNIEVATAHSGFEALDAVREKLPDLMILDVMMPGMDGFEVMDRLRRMPETARIPVMVLTGYSEMAERARAVGAAEVLLKPFERAALVQKVLNLLRTGGGHA